MTVGGGSLAGVVSPNRTRAPSESRRAVRMVVPPWYRAADRSRSDYTAVGATRATKCGQAIAESAPSPASLPYKPDAPARAALAGASGLYHGRAPTRRFCNSSGTRGWYNSFSAPDAADV